MINTLTLEKAMSSKEHIQDPYTRTSELMDDMLFFIELKRDNNSELSLEEIDEQLDNKRKIMIQGVVENLDEMEKKAKQVRESWDEGKGD